MKLEIINQLDQLNQRFYKIVAPVFSRTRKQPWAGWYKLQPFLQSIAHKDSIKIVDVGCGNARFARFLKAENPDLTFEYLGLDTNSFLLLEAEKELKSLTITHQLKQVNIVGRLLSKENILTETYDLITVFGVLHHVPSQKLRKEFFLSLYNSLAPGGVLVLTFWQFAANPKWQKRALSPNKVGILDEDLETGDYLLDWQKESTAVRYCHSVDEEEIKQLLLVASEAKVTRFEADGPKNTENLYLVITKPAPALARDFK